MLYYTIHVYQMFIFLSLYGLQFKMAAKRLGGKNGNNLIWIPENQNYKEKQQQM